MLKRENSVKSSDHFSRVTAKADFQQIYDVWRGACELEGLILSKAVVSELKKRISGAGSKGGKAKLNFYNCNIDDRKVVMLIEILALRPIISKLDLSGNDISNEGAKIILKLLKGQIKLVKTIPVESRLNAAFLGELSVNGSSKSIDPELLDTLQLLSETLKYCNAQAYVRKLYQEYRAPAQITTPFLTKLWTEVVGTDSRNQILKACNACGIAYEERNLLLNYTQLEKILLQGLTDKGSLSELNEWQRDQMAPVSRSLSPVRQHSSSRTARSVSPTSTITTATGGGGFNTTTTGATAAAATSAVGVSTTGAGVADVERGGSINDTARKQRVKDTNYEASDGQLLTTTDTTSNKQTAYDNTTATSTHDENTHDEMQPQMTTKPSILSNKQLSPVQRAISMSAQTRRASTGVLNSSGDNGQYNSGNDNFNNISRINDVSVNNDNTITGNNCGNSGHNTYNSSNNSNNSGSNNRSKSPLPMSQLVQQLSPQSVIPIDNSATTTNNATTTAVNSNNSNNNNVNIITPQKPNNNDNMDNKSNNSINDAANVTNINNNNSDINNNNLTSPMNSDKKQRRSTFAMFTSAVLDLTSSAKKNRKTSFDAGVSDNNNNSSGKNSGSSKFSPFGYSNKNNNKNNKNLPSPIPHSDNIFSDEDENDHNPHLSHRGLSGSLSPILGANRELSGRNSPKPLTYELDSLMSKLFPGADREGDRELFGEFQENNNESPETEDDRDNAGNNSSGNNNRGNNNGSNINTDMSQQPSNYIIIPAVNKYFKMNVLQLPSQSPPISLQTLDYSDYIDPGQYSALLVLVLRNNNIQNALHEFNFSKLFPNLTDLDLSYNCIYTVPDRELPGKSNNNRLKNNNNSNNNTISNNNNNTNKSKNNPDICLPVSLLRCDLSHNQITSTKSLIYCVNLLELNLSNNNIKRIDALPPKLRRLDISNNLITSCSILQTVMFCNLLVSLCLYNNPFIPQIYTNNTNSNNNNNITNNNTNNNNSSYKDYKITLRTNLVNLLELDYNTLEKVKLKQRFQKSNNISTHREIPGSIGRNNTKIINDRIQANINNNNNNNTEQSVVTDNTNNLYYTTENIIHRHIAQHYKQPNFNTNLVSREQQQLNDNMRYKLHLIKQQALEQSKLAYEKQLDALTNATVKYMHASDISELTARLSISSGNKEINNGINNSIMSAQQPNMNSYNKSNNNNNRQQTRQSTTAGQFAKVPITGTTPSSLINTYMNIRSAVDTPHTAGSNRELSRLSGQHEFSGEQLISLENEISQWIENNNNHVTRAAAVINNAINLSVLNDNINSSSREKAGFIAIASNNATNQINTDGSISDKTITTFTQSLKRIEFYHNVHREKAGNIPSTPIFPLSLEYKLAKNKSLNHKYHREIAGLVENMAKINMILSDIEQILTNNSNNDSINNNNSGISSNLVWFVDYQQQLDILFTENNNGIDVNTHILPVFGYQYTTPQSLTEWKASRNNTNDREKSGKKSNLTIQTGNNNSSNNKANKNSKSPPLKKQNSAQNMNITGINIGNNSNSNNQIASDHNTRPTKIPSFIAVCAVPTATPASQQDDFTYRIKEDNRTLPSPLHSTHNTTSNNNINTNSNSNSDTTVSNAMSLIQRIKTTDPSPVKQRPGTTSSSVIDNNLDIIERMRNRNSDNEVIDNNLDIIERMRNSSTNNNTNTIDSNLDIIERMKNRVKQKTIAAATTEQSQQHYNNYDNSTAQLNDNLRSEADDVHKHPYENNNNYRKNNNNNIDNDNSDDEGSDSGFDLLAAINNDITVYNNNMNNNNFRNNNSNQNNSINNSSNKNKDNNINSNCNDTNNIINNRNNNIDNNQTFTNDVEVVPPPPVRTAVTAEVPIVVSQPSDTTETTDIPKELKKFATEEITNNAAVEPKAPVETIATPTLQTQPTLVSAPAKLADVVTTVMANNNITVTPTPAVALTPTPSATATITSDTSTTNIVDPPVTALPLSSTVLSDNATPTEALQGKSPADPTIGTSTTTTSPINRELSGVSPATVPVDTSKMTTKERLQAKMAEIKRQKAEAAAAGTA